MARLASDQREATPAGWGGARSREQAQELCSARRHSGRSAPSMGACSARSAANGREVSAGGYPDLTLDRFRPLPRARRRPRRGPARRRRRGHSGELDFSNDTEVHVIAPRSERAPASSMAARSSSRPTRTGRDNTDETWVFLRGGFGELRFGDEDGPVDNSAVGGFTVAAGTGGIDGSVIDTFAGGPAFKPSQLGRRHQDPLLHARASAGFARRSATRRPTIRQLASTTATRWPRRPAIRENFVEGALGLRWCLRRLRHPGLGRRRRLGERQRRGHRRRRCAPLWRRQPDLWGFKLGGGTSRRTTVRRRRDFFNVGVGAGSARSTSRSTYGQVFDSENLVVDGADVGEPTTSCSRPMSA